MISSEAKIITKMMTKGMAKIIMFDATYRSSRSQTSASSQLRNRTSMEWPQAFEFPFALRAARRSAPYGAGLARSLQQHQKTKSLEPRSSGA